MKGVGRALLAFLLAFAAHGCAGLVLFGAGSAAGIAGYKYYNGSLTVDYQAPFEETWKAALKTVRNTEGVQGLKSLHTVSEGSISARFADGTPIRIKLRYKEERLTQVTIRVGILGDQQASEVVKEKIRRLLFPNS